MEYHSATERKEITIPAAAQINPQSTALMNELGRRTDTVWSHLDTSRPGKLTVVERTVVAIGQERVW